MPWHPCSNPSIHLTGHLGADGAAHQRHRLVRDPVEHLCSLSALGNHTGAVQHVQVLRHVRLGNFNGVEQLPHVLSQLQSLLMIRNLIGVESSPNSSAALSNTSFC